MDQLNQIEQQTTFHSTRNFLHRNWLILTLLAVGAGVRVLDLGTIPPALWYDEITGHYIPFLVLHQMNGSSSWLLIHGSPPDWTTTMRYLVTSAVQGTLWPGFLQTTSATILRLPAAIMGTALIISLYFAGRALSSPKTGLFAAALGITIPWTLYFSHYMVPIASMELWTLVSILFLAIYMQRGRRAYFIASLGTGSIVCYTHTSGIAVFILLLVPLWIAVTLTRNYATLRISPVREGTRLVWSLLPELAVVCLILFPLFILSLTPGSGPLSADVYVWQSCPSFGCVVSAAASRDALSWSPDFFFITGGLQGATSQGFNIHISIGGVYQAGGGYTGMLGPLGFLVYPALAFPIIRSIFRRAVDFWCLLAAFTILAFSFVGGVVTYDNPNAARLAFAVGPMILMTSLLFSEIVTFIEHRIASRRRRLRFEVEPVSNPARLGRRRRPSYVAVSTVVVVGLIVATGIPYTSWFFTQYANDSGAYFLPEIEETAQLITSHSAWTSRLVVLVPSNLTYVVPGELAFYDPYQPPPDPIVVFNGSIQANVGLLIDETNTVFVSLVGTTQGMLNSTGIPSVELQASNVAMLYLIPGLNARPTVDSSITNWSYEPTASFRGGQLNWTVSHVGNGETLSVATVGASTRIDSSLNESGQPTWWALTAQLPIPLPLEKYYLERTNWTFSASNNTEVLSIDAILNLSDGKSVLSGPLDYPGNLTNLGTASGELSGAYITGLQVAANMYPGSSQTTIVGGITIYNVIPDENPGCSGTFRLNGSAFDVAYVNGDGLVVNAATSSLSVDLCAAPNPSVTVPSSTYLKVNLTIIEPFSRNMDINATGPDMSGSISDIGGAQGTVATVWLPVPANAVRIGGVFELTITFVGQAWFTELSIVTYDG